MYTVPVGGRASYYIQREAHLLGAGSHGDVEVDHRIADARQLLYHGQADGVVGVEPTIQAFEMGSHAVDFPGQIGDRFGSRRFG